MEEKVKQKVWVVLERWSLNAIEHEVSVFDSREGAEEYAQMRAEDACKDIENGSIKYSGDEECYTGCDICVNDSDGEADEWWEAYIEEKEIN